MARRRERDRLEKLDEIEEAEMLARNFEEKILRNKLEADVKTSKNAEKRRKKKEKMKLMKISSSTTAPASGESVGAADNSIILEASDDDDE